MLAVLLPQFIIQFRLYHRQEDISIEWRILLANRETPPDAIDETAVLVLSSSIASPLLWGKDTR